MSGLRQWRASHQNEIHFATQQLSDLAEDQLVQQRRSHAHLDPVQFLVETKLKDLLEGDATFFNTVDDVFVDSIHDERNGAHHGGTQNGSIPFVSFADFGRHIRHGIGRGVSDLDAKQEHGVLGQ